MAQPTPYTREFNFSDQQAETPSDPLPAPHVDAEFNRIKLTTDEILANLELIQNDSGGLAAGVATYTSLSYAVQQMLALQGSATGAAVPYGWLTPHQIGTIDGTNDADIVEQTFIIGAEQGLPVGMPGPYRFKRIIGVPTRLRAQGFRSTMIRVDPAEIFVDSPVFPQIEQHLFVTCCDMENLTRAGQAVRAKLDEVIGWRDLDTYVSEVHFDGLNFDFSDIDQTLGASERLGAIGLYFSLGGSITNCTAIGVPNTPFLHFGGRDIDMSNNRGRDLGWYGYAGSSRNLISMTGLYEGTDLEYSTRGCKTHGNVGYDIVDAGLQFATSEGFSAQGNIFIGVKKGIEGDIHFKTVHYEGEIVASHEDLVNYEVQKIPASVIIDGNYIDGANPNPDHATTQGQKGIEVADANEGTVKIGGANVVKNMAINAVSVDRGRNTIVNIGPLTADGLALGSNSHVIYAKAPGGKLTVGAAKLYNLSRASGTNATVLTAQNFDEVEIGDGFESDSELTNFIYLSGTTATKIDIGKVISGGSISDQIEIAYSGNIDSLVVDARALRNSVSGAGTRGLIRFTNAACTVDSFSFNVRETSWVNVQVYPVNAGSLGSAAITEATAIGNKYGGTTGNRSVDSPSKFGRLIDHSNDCPSQRVHRGTAAPTTGTWSIGDEWDHVAKTSGSPPGGYCTVAGTPGTWVSYANL